MNSLLIQYSKQTTDSKEVEKEIEMTNVKSELGPMSSQNPTWFKLEDEEM
jgi:hypothetical protein